MEQQANRKYIAIIAFLRKFLSVFFSLFFNIYILKIVNNDLNFILKYTVYSVFLGIILEYILLKIINSKNASLIYRLSFILSAASIFILIIFKENIVKYIYLFKTLDTMKSLFYAVPYELIIIGSNTNKSMSSYLANLNILENITAILTPMFSGFIIEKFSYNILFIILGVETILIIAISMKIKDFTVQDNKINIKEFWKIAKEKPHLKDIYKCMFFRRISAQGAMTELLPIVLFLRLGTEMSFGSYNTLFAAIAIISLQILKMINNKDYKAAYDCLDDSFKNNNFESYDKFEAYIKEKFFDYTIIENIEKFEKVSSYYVCKTAVASGINLASDKGQKSFIVELKDDNKFGLSFEVE